MGTLNLAALRGTTRTPSGATLPSTVTVYPAGSVNEDGSLIGSPVAVTLYADQDGDTTLANPMTTEADGQFACYVAPGAYDLRFTGDNVTPRGIQNVQAPAAVNASGAVSLSGDVSLAADLDVAGTAVAEWLQFREYVTDIITATRTCTVDDLGKTFFVSAAGALTITLPPLGSDPPGNPRTKAWQGSWLRFINVSADACNPTYSGPVLGPNQPAGVSVTFPSGHRTGSTVRFIAGQPGGTWKWIAINESAGCAMTVNT